MILQSKEFTKERVSKKGQTALLITALFGSMYSNLSSAFYEKKIIAYILYHFEV